MKRRSVALSLGALAVGSGATFTSAAFDGTATSSGPGMGVVSAAGVNLAPVKENGSNKYDDNTTVDELNPSDLPVADVNDGDSNSDIYIDILTRIDASGKSFPDLFLIENNSTSPIEVDIDFTSVTSFTDGSPTKDEIKNAYSFKIDGTEISGDEATPVEIGSGATNNVDLEINFETPGIVSELRGEVTDGGDGAGNPFNGGDVANATRLVNEIEINTSSGN